MPKSNAVLLPGNVRPVKYALTLTPDLAAFTFRGEETVDIEVLEPTSEIVLNASELAIQTAEVSQGRARPVAAERISLDVVAETATLRFGMALKPGQAKLRLAFSGVLGDNLMGFYRAPYQGPDGQTRHMAATQFEASHARLAFPCWDEPALKARFEVTLVVPSGLAAISNMPVVEEREVSPSMKSVRFAESPVMSTYLLAFVVGDLSHIEQRAEGGTLVRVWARHGKEEQGRFALETAVRLLSYYNGYFGIPFPLEKLDHIAIPDFAAGAMENWGAITYRETALLVDPQHSAAATRQRVAEVVAHEMAHMWFGDLVTMQWWNDLWLNESFASWMGAKAVDNLFPDWRMWTQFVNDDTVHALGLDGLASSHPIEVEVKSPEEVEQIFDAISYSKGASLIRMLEQFLGAETFRTGLRQYLSAHTYGNARTVDLWEAMARASGQPVGEIMSTWTRQMGYPILEARVQRRPGQAEVHVAQHRFLYGHILRDEQDGSLWQVPVSVTAHGAPASPATLMKEREAMLSVNAQPDEWLKLNPGQFAFYRTNYEPVEWARLREAVATGQLAASDRLGLQDDCYALVRAGYLPATEFLALVTAYRNESDASVWRDLAANLGDLDTLVSREPSRAAFQRFARDLFRPAAQRMGWEARPGEGHLEALLRSTVLSQAGHYGDVEALRTAQAYFQRYAKDSAAVRPDIRGVVFGLAAKGGDDSTYEKLWELERKADLQEEKLRLLLALARFSQPELLRDTLVRSLSSDVLVQDTVNLVGAVAANNAGREPAWEFVKSNWQEFERRYGRGGFALTRLASITRGFASQDALADVERFWAAHPTPAADLAIKQSLEQIRLNIAWLERNRNDLARWSRT